VRAPDQVSQITETIERGRLKASFKTDREHARHVQEIVGSKGQGDLFRGVTIADRISFPVKQTRKVVGAVLPLVFAFLLFKAFAAFMTAPSVSTVTTQPPIANQQHMERQRLEAQQELVRLENERARRAELERARLASEHRAREAALERAFFESYEAPFGCDNWRSDRHMVECVDHRMRAKAEYFASKG